jgi:nucleotide-binding universal stress UspA family protein
MSEPATRNGYSKPVVVGIDGSDDGLRAVDYAAAEAMLRHAPLRIVTVLKTNAPFFVPDSGLVDSAIKKAEAANVAAARRASASGLPDELISTEVVQGHPGAELASRSAQACLMVLGRRGLTGLERVFAGSTSVYVGAKAACPVIVVPHGWRQVIDGHTGIGLRGVGVGIDGSSAASSALDAAFAEAEVRRVPLQIILAYQAELDMFAGAADYEVALAEWRDGAALRMAETVAGWRERYPDVVVEHSLVRSHPIDALIDASHDLELLVVGINGSGAMSGLILGTVARAVVASSACPVALVHQGSEGTESRREVNAVRQPVGA